MAMLDYMPSKCASCAVDQIQVHLLSGCCSYVSILKDIFSFSQEVSFEKRNQVWISHECTNPQDSTNFVVQRMP